MSVIAVFLPSNGASNGWNSVPPPSNPKGYYPPPRARRAAAGLAWMPTAAWRLGK